MEVLEQVSINTEFAAGNTVTVYEGDCLSLLAGMPNEAMQLVVTSPPYNIGKKHEKRLDIDE
jgi:adenine-specific DNA-methyltransferase